MAQNFIMNDGSIDYVVVTAPAVSGTPVKVGVIVGVPLASGAVGETVTLAIDGIFTLPKTAGQAWAQGAKLYWDATAGSFTTTSTSNTAAGYAASAALSAAITGSVLLKQVA